MREAPAPFKDKSHYYLITSACTGWKPNEADYAVADHILGPYHSKGNPGVGPEASTTFGAQSSFVLPVPGRPGTFIFAADQWDPCRLSDSRYLWLPLIVNATARLPLNGASAGTCRSLRLANEKSPEMYTNQPRLRLFTPCPSSRCAAPPGCP